MDPLGLIACALLAHRSLDALARMQPVARIAQAAATARSASATRDPDARRTNAPQPVALDSAASDAAVLDAAASDGVKAPELELRVRVLDPRGDALAGAQLCAWRRACNADPVRLEARGLDAWTELGAPRVLSSTDARGEARLHTSASGFGLELRATAAGVRARGTWLPGDPLTLELVARASHDVAIDVRDAADAPLAGAGVALFEHVADGALVRRAAVRSDEHGRAWIRDVEGRWSADTRVFVGLDGIELPPVELELERAALPSAPLELVARTSPGLRVTCVDARGAPITAPIACAAALADGDGNYTHWTARSYAGPSFELARVPSDARVHVSVESPRFGSASAVLEPLSIDTASDTVNDATSAAQRELVPRGVELRLANPTTSLGGVLLARDGAPLADACVRYALHLASSEQQRLSVQTDGVTRTDARGAWWLPIGPTLAELRGRVTLYVETGGDAARELGASIALVRESGCVHLELGAQHTSAARLLVAGRVVTPTGEGVADAWVRCAGALRGEALATTSRADGRYELWGFARADAQRCSAGAADRVSSKPEPIECGARDHVIVLAPAVRLRGRVRVPSGADARLWRVRACAGSAATIEAAEPFECALDAAGRYAIAGFPRGSVRIVVSSAEWIDGDAEFGPFDAAREPDGETPLDCTGLTPFAFDVVGADETTALDVAVRCADAKERAFLELGDGRFRGWARARELALDVRDATGALHTFDKVVDGARLRLPPRDARR